jgi:hypothetical protein
MFIDRRTHANTLSGLQNAIAALAAGRGSYVKWNGNVAPKFSVPL